MNIAPIQSPTVDAQDIAPEDLMGNKHLTEDQKVARASQEFESIMLQQILAETQKPVITSEFTDNSTAAGIYQDYVSQTLAENMSKAGTLGFAKVFEQQLSHHQKGNPSAAAGTSPATAVRATGTKYTPTPLSAVNLKPAMVEGLPASAAQCHE